MTSFNAFGGGGRDAFMDSGFDARSDLRALSVVNRRNNEWTGNGGQQKTVWRRSPADLGVADWAWDSGVNPTLPSFSLAHAVNGEEGTMYVSAPYLSTTWDADANNTAGPGTGASVWKLDKEGTPIWHRTMADFGSSTNGAGALDFAQGDLWVAGVEGVYRVNAAGTLKELIPIASGTMTGWNAAAINQLGDLQIVSPSVLYHAGFNGAGLYKRAIPSGNMIWNWGRFGLPVTGGVLIQGMYASTSAIYVAAARENAWYPSVEDEENNTNQQTANKSLFKLSPSGTVLWAWDHGTGDSTFINVASDVYQRAGTVVVVGTRSPDWHADAAGNAGSGENKSLWVMNTSGTVQWAWDSGRTLYSCAIGPDGTIYCAGQESDEWHLDSSGTAGPGTLVNCWALDPTTQSVVATFHCGNPSDSFPRVIS